MDQKSSEKTEKILKQENCAGEVKTNWFIYATGVLWVQKEKLQSNVPDANSGIMAKALSSTLRCH